MPQAKINSFFQPSCSKTQSPILLPKVIEASDMLSGDMSSISPAVLALEDSDLASKSGFHVLSQRECEYKSNASSSSSFGRNLRKKRNYEQLHLDLGQSDFILHTCSVCGQMYTCGVEEDEKIHRKFHQDYDRGIQFKGWHNERVVSGPLCIGDRILLIIDSDLPTQKRVVQKVVNFTKKELGFIDDHIIHALCKVYLFISAHRIVGWLVAEPIQTAHRIISTSSLCSSFDNSNPKITDQEQMNSTDLKKSHETTLQFGNIMFHRELIKKDCPTTSINLNKWNSGAIFCDEEAVPAKCGMMAIWVVPSSRRKRVASQLMDVARKTFSTGQILEISDCAFFSPTSAGMAFASGYAKSRSFLVYRADDV